MVRVRLPDDPGPVTFMLVESNEAVKSGDTMTVIDGEVEPR
jgi:hypothetical protein